MHGGGGGGGGNHKRYMYMYYIYTDLCAELHVHCQCKICQVEHEASQSGEEILNRRHIFMGHWLLYISLRELVGMTTEKW